MFLAGNFPKFLKNRNVKAPGTVLKIVFCSPEHPKKHPRKQEGKKCKTAPSKVIKLNFKTFCAMWHFFRIRGTKPKKISNKKSTIWLNINSSFYFFFSIFTYILRPVATVLNFIFICFFLLAFFSQCFYLRFSIFFIDMRTKLRRQEINRVKNV